MSKKYELSFELVQSDLKKEKNTENFHDMQATAFHLHQMMIEIGYTNFIPFGEKEIVDWAIKNVDRKWLTEAKNLYKKLNKRFSEIHIDHMSVLEALYKIAHEQDYAWTRWLMKSATRQNLVEKLCKTEFGKLGLGYKDLPGTHYLQDNGLILTRTKPGRPSFEECVSTKSIDFVTVIGNKTFYAQQKYVAEPGGSQDNNGKGEMDHWMKVAKFNQDPNTYFTVVADGLYAQYSFESLRYNETSRIKVANFENYMNYLLDFQTSFEESEKNTYMLQPNNDYIQTAYA